MTQAFSKQDPEPVKDERNELVSQAQIINVIDQRVVNISPFFTYTIAKMALWSFTQTAAQEMAPRVRVNGIGPGPTLKAEQSQDSFLTKTKYCFKAWIKCRDIISCLWFFLKIEVSQGS